MQSKDEPEAQRNTYNETHRGHRIVCITHKFSDSRFWMALGWAEIDYHGQFRIKQLTGTTDKFTDEDGAKNEFIELAKECIDSQLV